MCVYLKLVICVMGEPSGCMRVVLGVLGGLCVVVELRVVVGIYIV